MLPSSLNAIDEACKIVIAYACETHNALEAEAVKAKQQYQQMDIATRSYELHMVAAHNKVQRVKQNVDILVNIALDQAEAATNSKLMISPWKAACCIQVRLSQSLIPV
jgi:hypothetical protein